MAPSDAMKARAEAFGSDPGEVLWTLCPKCMATSATGIYLLPLRAIKGSSNRLYALGFSWTALTNNSKEGFSCLVGVLVR